MNPANSATATVCVHEDRAHCLTGAKMAVLSLRDVCPGLRVVMSCPNPPAAFAEWLGRQDGVTLVSYPETQNCSWNVKPTVLLKLLSEGYGNVLWVDSDIVVHKDVLTRIALLHADVMAGTQETYWGQSQGGTARTEAWGLKAKRAMPFTINSGVLRVTAKHTALLEAWVRMLAHPLYVRAQAMHWYERPLHMITDQEVLTALMGSEEFGDVPYVLLQRGVEIAQCMGPGGFTPTERIRSISAGLPGLIHSMGCKPWTKGPTTPSLGGRSGIPLAARLRAYYEYLHVELSPYDCVAKKYGEALDEDAAWLTMVSLPARAMAAVTGHSPALQEMPLAVLDSAVRRLRAWLNIARYPIHEEFRLRESPLS